MTIKRLCALVVAIGCGLGWWAGTSGCRRETTTQAAARAVPDATGQPVAITDISRVVAAGGSVTEIVYALGADALLVGCDASSLYPEAAAKLPQVGYVRALSAEGVLSLRPTLVLTVPEAGPPEALAQLRNSGTPVLVVPAETSLDGVKRKIQTVAQALDRQAQGDQLIAQLESDLAQARAYLAGRSDRPKVMFIYARGQGAANVAGRDTAAAEMIRLAGGINAFDFEGYKPLTAEAAVAAAPDVILLPSRGLESSGGIDGVLAMPGVKQTPAGRNRRIVAVDDLLLLGFGPRTGQGVLELSRLLHPAT
ncbi:MAG: hemin ABC transporter substrate-binding protein [Chloracidobacterium sp.]|uniref:Hemin ABC transporter substrate-binding protein n=1 Tax=Chloracidobacterium validum TaxID=2821543 RepID=A0ABX8BAV3_9BACT|nr:hemin ABC transporter substrate-binding protein [Chloracidobacterium validum]QUW03542.1 hemin ABC transporter substrate-binding protein [Chloracidobacterium validum]